MSDDRVYAAISDAFYDARNAGRTMADATRGAAEVVEKIIEDRIAAERERIAQAIEAERFDFTFGAQKGNSEAFQKGYRRALGTALVAARSGGVTHE